MLTFIYPKGDWAAVELVIKIQALAASQDYKVYVTPKNTRRDEINIKRRLKNTKYAVFVAIEANTIDEYTKEELKFLKTLGIPIYTMISKEFSRCKDAREIINLLEKDKIFIVDKNNPKSIINTLSKILRDIKEGEQQKGEDIAGTIALTAVLGLLLLFLALMFGRKDAL